MLTVGDKVVYPMHGAGVIEAIEEHEVLGDTKKYYILSIPYGAMRVMIPVNNVENLGLREIIGPPEVQKVMDILQKEPVPEQTTWNRRVNANLIKIKSGCVYKVAEVVRNLTLQGNGKRLSTGERRLLDTAKQILISELVLACNKDARSVEALIEDCMKNTPGN